MFFNAYVLSENGVPQGLYCSLYNETWGPSYATNYGQYRGNDEYSVSDSYSYSVENQVTQPAYASGCVTSQCQVSPAQNEQLILNADENAAAPWTVSVHTDAAQAAPPYEQFVGSAGGPSVL